jgi:uncharacterized protein YukJ
MVHARRRPPNARRTYGVLVGQVRDGRLKTAGSSPHYEIWIAAGDENHRAAVNVRSVDGSDVQALFVPAFSSSSAKLDLAAFAGRPGFTAIATGPGGNGLDYLRDGIVDVPAMHDIPMEGGGISLANLLDASVERAKADDAAVAIILGEHFADADADETFGFSPEQGIHDVHMMQGNRGSFAGDNRVNGDGALFIRFNGGETVALFARFSVQDVHTDNGSGAPLDSK